MADRERKEQEPGTVKRNGAAKNMNPTSKSAGTVNAGNVRKIKNAQRKTVTHKKDKKRKNDSDFERQRKWKFDPSQSGGEGD